MDTSAERVIMGHHEDKRSISEVDLCGTEAWRPVDCNSVEFNYCPYPRESQIRINSVKTLPLSVQSSKVVANGEKAIDQAPDNR